MSTWAVIPLKHLRDVKSSFSGVFTPGQRKEFALCMLEDVLTVLRETELNILVVSPDREVLNFVAERGIKGALEPGVELNQALKFGIQKAVEGGATAVLILPADLPLLKSVDIEWILNMDSSPRGVVIAPSKANGTNALLLRPPDIINLRFGGESFPLHVAETVRVGIKPRIFRSSTLAFDVDEPADLPEIEKVGFGTKTYNLLAFLRQK